MTMYQCGDWHYDLNIVASGEQFVWYVVRLKIDPARITQMVLGTWVYGGIAATREEAELEGVEAIDHHSKLSG